ncbi:hypothetical protein F5882DRAFT_480240 [Hyaloscypha sp. PMI_1271]|nr:hypothetical protein F5882DRAFT_480240 [Hyaloscypha sp. PMI_1271]
MEMTTTPSVVTPDGGTPLARFPVDSTTPPRLGPLSPLPASTPTEPKAMAVAKATQLTPQKPTKQKGRQSRSQSPSRPNPKAKQRSEHVSTPTESKKRSSGHKNPPNVMVLPTRKRCGDYLPSSPPAAKHQAFREYTQAPAPRPRHDHWSPPSSRASSPARSDARVVPVSVASLYSPLKSTRTTPSLETPRPRVATPSSATPGGKKYPSLTSVAVEKVVDEEADSKICYNCGQKGHWFMNCTSGCGRCNGDGHRTIDCTVVKPHVRSEMNLVAKTGQVGA